MAPRRKSGQQRHAASNLDQGVIDCGSTISGGLPLAQPISKPPTKKPAKPHRDSSSHVTTPDPSLNRVSSQRGRSDNDIVHFANNSLLRRKQRKFGPVASQSTTVPLRNRSALIAPKRSVRKRRRTSLSSPIYHGTSRSTYGPCRRPSPPALSDDRYRRGLIKRSILTVTYRSEERRVGKECW